MSELTDDQLDGLFRKSAEEFDPPFDPAAWQDMKSRLDTNDRPAPGGSPLWKTILRWGLPVCLLLLLMFGGWYTYNHITGGRNDKPVMTTKQPHAATSQQMANPLSRDREQPAESHLVQSDSRQTTPSDISAQSIDNNNQPAVLEKSVNKPAADELGTNVDANRPKGAGETNIAGVARATNEVERAYREKTSRSGLKPVTVDHSRPIAERTELASAVAGKTGQRTKRIASERLVNRKQKRADRLANTGTLFGLNGATPSRSSFGKKSFDETSEVNQSVAGHSPDVTVGVEANKTEMVPALNVSELAIRPARWPKALPFTGRDVAVAAQPDTIAQKVKPAVPVQRGLSIRFAVSPDLSSIGLRNFGRPGTNVGVLLEYRIAPRWSVQAGIIQSTKIYEAYSSDYTVPPGSYLETVRSKIGSIDGKCTMFDIPINLRYDFVLRPRASGLLPSRWFVSSGVTSYYIKQEDYVYNYTGYVHNAVTTWSTKTGGYGLSHLNVSVGYERALTKRLSWQVEPFMKMPLKSVGYYKINLVSTGAFFSIRYKL